MWSPIAPKELVLGLLPDMQQAIIDALVPHVWSLAVARPDAEGFICSDSPLVWSRVEPWEPGFKENESLDDLDLTVTFPLNKKLALITRPYDRGQKGRYRYFVGSEVVAWVNSRTHIHSLGTHYSASQDFGLLKKGNEIGRSIDYFSHIESMRRGTTIHQERRE